jgi:beta-aspartyl-peptidase (threonine type)
MYSIAIHGGAGAITRSLMTPDQQKGYEQALDQALRRGSQILANGGAALDAVTEAVVALEDCPLFNAGKGSVFNHEGSH